jgi:hypothetical protein
MGLTKINDADATEVKPANSIDPPMSDRNVIYAPPWLLVVPGLLAVPKFQFSLKK